MFDITQIAQNTGQALDIAGIVVVMGGVAISTVLAVYKMFLRKGVHNLYKSYRQNMARSILVGLEFLVAGDIIRSVGGDLSLESVIVLGLIVLIRSVLGIEFEMEIEGRWPWQQKKSAK